MCVAALSHAVAIAKYFLRGAFLVEMERAVARRGKRVVSAAADEWDTIAAPFMTEETNCVWSMLCRFGGSLFSTMMASGGNVDVSTPPHTSPIPCFLVIIFPSYLICI